MKDSRALLLSLTFISVLAISFQTNAQVEKQTKAFLVDSYGRTTDVDFKGRADVFMNEIKQYPGSRALILLYGPSDQINIRTRLIKEHFSFRRFPTETLEVKVGGNVSEFRSDFWIIPAGAASPEIKPEASIASEFASITAAGGKRRIAAFFTDEKRACSNQVYIINYGTPKQIAQRETWFRNTRVSCGYDGPRITLVNGGSGPVRTVIWLVPPGAVNPTP